MEKLFYSLQFDKRIKRHIHLLKYLDRQNSIVSADVIAKELQCTIPTLRSDIVYLNSRLGHGCIIKEYFRSGYFLENQQFRSIESFIGEYAQETLPYKIINDIFHCRILTIRQAEREYFVSSSVIRKAIKHMNNVLESFDIMISSNKIDFVGDEVNIRFFLFVFFNDFRNNFIFVSQMDIQEKIYQDIVLKIKSITRRNMNYSYSRAISWIMVNTVRMMHNKDVIVNQEIKPLLDTYQSFQAFKEVFNSLIKDTLNIVSSGEDEVYWAYVLRLHCVSYTPGEKKDNICLLYHNEYDETTGEIVKKITDDAIDQGLIRDKSFSYHLVKAYLINICLLRKVTEHFLRVSNPLSKFISESNAQSVSKWQQVLKRCNNLDLKYYLDVAVSLTMLSYNDQTAIQPKKHILISFHTELGYDHFLYQICKTMIDENVDAVYYENNIVDEKYLRQNKVDLIICNYDLVTLNEDVTVFRLSYIPTSTEWLLLREAITGENRRG